MLTHKPTVRTETLVHQLTALAREIDGSCITLASPAARVEWTILREKWPTLADVRAGLVYLSDEALEVMIVKVRRFHDILLGPRRLEPLLAAA
ncbi:MAG TPA: hypothetical protein VMU50_09165 [Polyangia bacterium]|nr:hypothetical protein [Polyangia bacterium]